MASAAVEEAGGGAVEGPRAPEAARQGAGAFLSVSSPREREGREGGTNQRTAGSQLFSPYPSSTPVGSQ